MSDKKEIKIIMIEDDQGHAGLIKENLRDAGITNDIIHFDDGQEAVDAILANKDEILPAYAVILLDLNLPGLDGYQILEKLRLNEKTKRTPVCMLTTTEDEREVERCYSLGCNVYVKKPVEYNEFQDAMKKLGIMLSLVKIPKTK